MSASTTLTPAQHRAELARAERRAQRTGDSSDRAEVQRIRSEYTEAHLAAHIDRVVSKAPPLTDEQVDRLAAILRRGGQR